MKKYYLNLPFYKRPLAGMSDLYSIAIVLIEFSKIIRKEETGEILIKDGYIINNKGSPIKIFNNDRAFCFYNGAYSYNLDYLSLTEKFFDNNVLDNKETALLQFELMEIGGKYNG